MNVASQTVERTDELEELDFDLPCQVKAPEKPCPNAADWMLLLSCGHQVSFCDIHWTWLNRNASHLPWFICTMCGPGTIIGYSLGEAIVNAWRIR